MKKQFIILTIFCSIVQAQFTSLVQTSSATITRTASNITTYSAGDVIRDTISTRTMVPITMTSVKNANNMLLWGAALHADTANSTGAIFRLLLYKDSTGMGASMAADNAAYQMKQAADTSFIAEIPIVLQTYGTTAGGATGARGIVQGLQIPFKLKPNVTTLYAVLLADGSYVPKAGGKFMFYFWIYR